MTTGEARERLNELVLRYPSLTGDIERQMAIIWDLERYDAQCADEAIDRYLRLGENLLNIAKLTAIAHAIARDNLRDQESSAQRRARQRAMQAGREHHERLARADAHIARMADDEVMHLWRALTEIPNAVPDFTWKFPASKVRDLGRFRLFVAEYIEEQIPAA